MGKKCRGVRANWDEDMMEEALKLLKEGKSQRFVETHCGIPRRTLRNHLKSGISHRKLGTHSVLTKEQEVDLENRIIRFSKIGFPLTPKTMRRCVYKFVVKHNIKHPFSETEQMAGREWFRLFLKRHPSLSKRKAQSMNPARAQKLNPFIVNDYFNKLEKVVSELNLKASPQNIFNLDEKGVRLNLHHQQSVVAAKGAKRVHLVSQEHGQNVTVVACASASGTVIPPMLLFKGVRYKKYFRRGLPPGSKVCMTPKGSMTGEVFVKCLDHFAKYKPCGPTLLILDGAKCHLDISIVDKADEHDITLFCLPSNTTHELQPLDKSVFRSFEHHWDQQLLLFQEEDPEEPDRSLTKETFSDVFTPVWSKCMTLSNITNGFRATGIWPFNRSIVPEEAFAPSLVTQQDYDSDDDKPLSVRIAAAQKRSPFQKMMPTPRKKKKNVKATAPRRKTINYKAQRLTRNLFGVSPNEKQTSDLEIDCIADQPTSAVQKTSSFFSNQPSKSGIQTTSSLLSEQPPTPDVQTILLLPSDQPSTTAVRNTSSHPSCEDDSWYCAVCEEEYVADMRVCSNCGTWVHEECVGLTKDDKEDFFCPQCS